MLRFMVSGNIYIQNIHGPLCNQFSSVIWRSRKSPWIGREGHRNYNDLPSYGARRWLAGKTFSHFFFPDNFVFSSVIVSRSMIQSSSGISWIITHVYCWGIPVSFTIRSVIFRASSARCCADCETFIEVYFNKRHRDLQNPDNSCRRMRIERGSIWAYPWSRGSIRVPSYLPAHRQNWQVLRREIIPINSGSVPWSKKCGPEIRVLIVEPGLFPSMQCRRMRQLRLW